MVEQIGSRVIGDEQIGPAVQVIVTEQSSKSVVLISVLDARLSGDLDKPAVAVVAVEAVCRTLEAAGAAEYIHRLPLAERTILSLQIRIEIHVVRHVEIQIAVQIVVAEGGARTPSRVADSGEAGNVRKAAVPLVAVETVGAVVGDIQVHVPVVVVVGADTTHSPGGIPHARRLGNVAKCSV